MSRAARSAVLNRYASDGMATTSPQRLVVLLFQRLVADLDKAHEAAEGGRIEATHDALVHAQEIVYELRLALDVDSFEGAKELASLYDHLMEQMVEANRTKSTATIQHCRSVAEPLAETFAEAHQLSVQAAASSLAGQAG
ncbi:MAG: flagellar export chaperone FliS [Acidimicrobiales bacterium]